MFTLDRYLRDPNYQHLSFLLRIWKDGRDGEWRATLQNVINGKCYHFASLNELYANLQDLTSHLEVEHQQTPFEPVNVAVSNIEFSAIGKEK